MQTTLELSKDDDIYQQCPRGDWSAGQECISCPQALDCLPFERRILETNNTDSTSQARCFAIRPDVAPVLVSEQGCSVGISSERLEIRRSGQCIGDIRLCEISSVQMNGAVQISSQAVKALSERSIPLFLCSQSGYLIANVLKGSNRDGRARVRQIQLATDSELSLQLAKTVVFGKIHNQHIFLRRRLGKNGAGVAKLNQLCSRIRRISSKPELLGIEGGAAKSYFTGMAEIVGGCSGFQFTGRTRRPPRDPINALLSYGYSVLHTEVLKAVLAAGLDPAVGFLHEIHSGRDSLVCDLVEEFRAPIIDSVVLTLVRRRQVRLAEFHLSDEKGCLMESSAKKTLLYEIERRMRESLRHPLFEYRVSWRRAIQLQATLLKHSLLHGKFNWQPFSYR